MYQQITAYGFTCDVPYCSATTGGCGSDANEAQTAALLDGWDVSEVMIGPHLCPEHVALKPAAAEQPVEDPAPPVLLPTFPPVEESAPEPVADPVEDPAPAAEPVDGDAN